MATELILIRHGQSEGNTGVSKDPDCRLTEMGVEQARTLGARLADFDLTGFTGIASPYMRTWNTAAEVSQATGLPFAVEELVREWSDVAAIKGRQYHKETIAELITRLEEFLRIYAGRKLVVVSHAAPIALLTQLAWGETPNIQGQFWNGVNNCCLRRLQTT
ncbi:MAG TPA: histidine phosphatase family protein [Tepidisphaeraceae bacterium]|jgi:broad specificity phosphatase PhoE|nr:histidine phosphatase family protein [Tepidisphaeraceae bacterium]